MPAIPLASGRSLRRRSSRPGVASGRPMQPRRLPLPPGRPSWRELPAACRIDRALRSVLPRSLPGRAAGSAASVRKAAVPPRPGLRKRRRMRRDLPGGNVAAPDRSRCDGPDRSDGRRAGPPLFVDRGRRRGFRRRTDTDGRGRRWEFRGGKRTLHRERRIHEDKAFRFRKAKSRRDDFLDRVFFVVSRNGVKKESRPRNGRLKSMTMSESNRPSDRIARSDIRK